MEFFCFQFKTYFISLQICLLMKEMAIFPPRSSFQELKKPAFIKMPSHMFHASVSELDPLP